MGEYEGRTVHYISITPQITDALKRARIPEPLQCPVSGEMMYSPLDKLSIGVYNKSIAFIEDESIEADELLKLAALI